METSRGGAAAATWRVRGDESRRRRGRDDRGVRDPAKGTATLGRRSTARSGPAKESRRSTLIRAGRGRVPRRLRGPGGLLGRRRLVLLPRHGARRARIRRRDLAPPQARRRGAARGTSSRGGAPRRRGVDASARTRGRRPSTCWRPSKRRRPSKRGPAVQTAPAVQAASAVRRRDRPRVATVGPPGVLVNLGPLLYHWVPNSSADLAGGLDADGAPTAGADDRYDRALEFSWDELRQARPPSGDDVYASRRVLVASRGLFRRRENQGPRLSEALSRDGRRRSSRAASSSSTRSSAASARTRDAPASARPSSFKRTPRTWSNNGLRYVRARAGATRGP